MASVETIPERSGRLPPQDVDAERSVLGAMLLDEGAASEVLSLVGPDDFYRPAHARVFEAMQQLFEKNEPLDEITVLAQLRATGQLEGVGGATYLASLTETVPTAANAAHYARIVRDRALSRRLINAATVIAGQGYEGGEIDMLLDQAESKIFEITRAREHRAFTPLKEAVKTAFKQIEALYERKEAITGVPTGFADLDKCTSGFQRSDLIIIAGRPSMGKCLSADAELVLADGSVATMAEINGRRAAELLTLGDDLRFRLTRPSAFVDDGVKPVYRVTTRLGRAIKTTASHPYLTLGGWRPLAALRPGVKVAVPRRLEIFGRERVEPGRVIAAADLIGRRKPAHDEVVPPFVNTLCREQVGLFVNRLFAADGWARVLASGQPQVGYATRSERLARQVQHLLLRFGVVAALHRRAAAHHPAWQLEVTDAASLATFATEIGISGKEEAVAAVLTAVRSRRHETSGLGPAEVWQQLALEKGAESWASVARRAGGSSLHVGTRALSRQHLAALALAIGGAELVRLARSDVYWDEIVSIEPVGCEQVYDLTIPETHNFVANDICVHNTAFALNIGLNAAIRSKTPVAVFSLEMSKEQLVMRMLCSEARIDAQRLRSGFLKESDWPKLAKAAGMLAEAPVYIDDSGAISILEMRAKARRLQAEKGLGMIIVDYLQLMRGRSGAEGREREISEISRGLKALAKELSVPVIALSQLNRSLEQRTDKRPMLSDLRECVTGDTLVVLADGRRIPIHRLVGTQPEVVAIGEGRELCAARSDLVWSVGRRPVFTLALAGGRSVRATAKHRLLTGAGWKRIGELAAGDRVGVAVGDLVWDRVVGIEPAGEEEVFDLTVPGPACWLADGIVSHNSGAIEQDADVICFVYRDEYYDPNSADKGLAEIIVGKQRNGPTDTVKLRFFKEYTRFDSAAPRDGQG